MKIKNLFHMNTDEGGAELAQRERTQLRRVLGSIQLSPRKKAEISQNLKECLAQKDRR